MTFYSPSVPAENTKTKSYQAYIKYNPCYIFTSGYNISNSKNESKNSEQQKIYTFSGYIFSNRHMAFDQFLI